MVDLTQVPHVGCARKRNRHGLFPNRVEPVVGDCRGSIGARAGASIGCVERYFDKWIEETVFDDFATVFVPLARDLLGRNDLFTR